MPESTLTIPAASAGAKGHGVMPPVHDLLACVGVVNLMFLNLWLQLQLAYAAPINYFRAAAPSATLLGATLMLVLFAAAGGCGALVIARRIGSRRLPQLGRCLFLLALAISTPGLAIAMSFPLSEWALRAAFLLDRVWLAAGMAGAALMWVGGSERLFRAARHLAIVFSPLLPIVAANSALDHWTASRAARPGSFESAALPGLPASREVIRTLVLVFDEFDALAAFSKRPAGIRMPVFDRLRKEALCADDVNAPARCTFQSLPKLLTGRNDLTPAADEPSVKIGRLQLPTRWGSGPNLFSEARGAGARTALIGWYHPYCSPLAGSVDYCWSLPCRDVSPARRLQEYCAEAGLAGCTVQVLRRHVDGLLGQFTPNLQDPEPARREHEALRRWSLQGYLEMRKRVLDLTADPSYAFIVAHLPVPHPPGIYDRHTGHLTLNEASNYFDNLELADSLLGEIRTAMERARLWDSTALILTSDHGLRPQEWKRRPIWTSEEEAVSQGRESLKVPLIVKLPGAAQRSQFTKPINALIVHDLALDLLKGRISSYENLHQWMGRNRDRTWVHDFPSCF